MRNLEMIQQAYVTSHILEDDGQFPNNKKLPLIVYKGALLLHPNDGPEEIQAAFEQNNWSNSWVDGIFDHHHYHSITHEVLGIVSGFADVQFGGPAGVCVELVRGDVVIIPAGVAHKNLKASDNFCCVGAYPDGKDYDIKYGKPEERPEADENIAKVPIPQKDPVYGDLGSLHECWGHLWIL